MRTSGVEEISSLLIGELQQCLCARTALLRSAQQPDRCKRGAHNVQRGLEAPAERRS